MEDVVKGFLRDERGTETVEWAIMIGIIAVGAITAILTIGNWVVDKFTELQTAIETAP